MKLYQADFNRNAIKVFLSGRLKRFFLQSFFVHRQPVFLEKTRIVVLPCKLGSFGFYLFFLRILLKNRTFFPTNKPGWTQKNIGLPSPNLIQNLLTNNQNLLLSQRRSNFFKTRPAWTCIQTKISLFTKRKFYPD